VSGSLRHPEFAARVGAEVTLRALGGSAAGQDVPATLAACSDAVRTGDVVSFSVSFVAGPGAPREQAVFELAAPDLDVQPIFLVPHRVVGDRVEYEAVFNQTIDGSES
jgi:hypothetical protein